MARRATSYCKARASFVEARVRFKVHRVSRSEPCISRVVAPCNVVTCTSVGSAWALFVWVLCSFWALTSFLLTRLVGFLDSESDASRVAFNVLDFFRMTDNIYVVFLKDKYVMDYYCLYQGCDKLNVALTVRVFVRQVTESSMPCLNNTLFIQVVGLMMFSCLRMQRLASSTLADRP